MRCLSVAVVLGVTLFAAVGCSGERDTTGSLPTPTGSTAAVSPATGTIPGGVTVTAPAGGNAMEVCAVATKVNAESAQKYVTELGRYLQAGAEKDTKRADAAKRTILTTLDIWASVLREQSTKATDPQLKAVLADIGTEVAGLSVDGDAMGEVGFDLLQQRLGQLCGG